MPSRNPQMQFSPTSAITSEPKRHCTALNPHPILIDDDPNCGTYGEADLKQLNKNKAIVKQLRCGLCCFAITVVLALVYFVVQGFWSKEERLGQVKIVCYPLSELCSKTHATTLTIVFYYVKTTCQVALIWVRIFSQNFWGKSCWLLITSNNKD